MDAILGFWAFLMENQVFLAFPIILVIWLIVRGYDLGKWIRKKARNAPSDSQEVQDHQASSEDP